MLKTRPETNDQMTELLQVKIRAKGQGQWWFWKPRVSGIGINQMIKKEEEVVRTILSSLPSSSWPGFDIAIGRILRSPITSFSLPLISWLIGQISNLPSVCVRACMLSSVWLFGPHWLQPMSLLCPWDYPIKNTGVCCHFLLQGIYLTQGSNLIFLHILLWQTDSLPLSLLGSLVNTYERRIWSVTAASVQFSCSFLSNSLWPHGL